MWWLLNLFVLAFSFIIHNDLIRNQRRWISDFCWYLEVIQSFKVDVHVLAAVWQKRHRLPAAKSFLRSFESPPTHPKRPFFQSWLDVSHHLAWWHGLGSLAKSAHYIHGQPRRRLDWSVGGEVNLRSHLESWWADEVAANNTIGCKKRGSLTVVCIKTQFHWSFFLIPILLYLNLYNFSTTFKV